MSKPMKKGTKIVLAVLIVAVLLAACFASVALYAKREFEKEKSWLPPKLYPQHASVTELPEDLHSAYEYVTRLWNEAVSADNAEASWNTEVDLGGELTLPFGDTDNALIDMIRGGAKDAVQALYPTASGVKHTDEKAGELPQVTLKESDILEYPYNAENVFNRKGEYKSDTYEIVFKLDPAFENTEEIRHGAVYEGVCEILKSAVTVNNADLDTQAVEMRFYVDRLADRLTRVEISRSYKITADVTLTEDYAALSQNGEKDAQVKLPYKATEKISFMWYGLRFTEDYLEQRPDDITTLPLDIHVNAAAVQGEDFTVDYEISDPETMEIDKECVMTVKKTNDVSATEGVKIKATLTYEGRTYSDEITIYITKLEKTTAGVRFWEESAAVAKGETKALPAEIRVPVNESADDKREEEYELFLEISDPEALSVEIDGKDLFATGLKTADAPVTVTLTMKCGGHVYTASLPVNVTETEAAGNG